MELGEGQSSSRSSPVLRNRREFLTSERRVFAHSHLYGSSGLWDPGASGLGRLPRTPRILERG